MLSSKYCYVRSPLVLDVLVDGEKEHEGKEKTGAAQEVPDIVPLQNFVQCDILLNLCSAMICNIDFDHG